jgi:hypothetical protein
MPNVERFSRALFALHSVGCLEHETCKPAVGAFIRDATVHPCYHVTTNYRSISAAAKIAQQVFHSAAQYHRWCKNNLRHEHMVPTSVIRTMLLQATQPLTQDAIAVILRRFSIRATITLEEDGILNARGFAQSMPDGCMRRKIRV